MTVGFFTFDEQPDLADRYHDETEEVWPPGMEIVDHDPVSGVLAPFAGNVSRVPVRHL